MTKKFISPTIICVGILFMYLGYLKGEIFAVLQKSIKICLECIGIG